MCVWGGGGLPAGVACYCLCDLPTAAGVEDTATRPRRGTSVRYVQDPCQSKDRLAPRLQGPRGEQAVRDWVL